MSCPGFSGDFQVGVKPPGPDLRFPRMRLPELGRRHVANRAEQAAIVESVDPFPGGRFKGQKVAASIAGMTGFATRGRPCSA